MASLITPEESELLENITSLIDSWQSEDRKNCLPAKNIIRLSDASELRKDRLTTDNPGVLLIRHLYKAFGLDEKRICEARFEHKIVQSLLVEHYCPGAMPDLVTLSAARGDMPLSKASAIVEDMYSKGYFIKSSLGESSGEHFNFDKLAEISGLGVERVFQMSACALPEQNYFFQHRLQIDQEFRVHSFEEAVVPDLSYRRFDIERTHHEELASVNDFVQHVLDNMPVFLIRDSLYAWDIAKVKGGGFRVVEVNSTGIHTRYKPEFHCSGFFMNPLRRVVSIVTLLRFIEDRYQTEIEVWPEGSGEGEPWATYWWVSRYKHYLDLLAGKRVARSRHDGASPTIILGPEQRIFSSAIEKLDFRLGSEPRFEETSNQLNEGIPKHAQPVFSSTLPSVKTSERQNFSAPKRVHLLFESMSLESPDSIAVSGELKQIPYRLLDQYANHLAKHLVSLGAVAGDRVAIYMDPGEQSIIAVLAIHKMHCSYVPCDPMLPRERLLFQVHEACCSIVLVDQMSSRAAEMIFTGSQIVVAESIQAECTSNLSGGGFSASATLRNSDEAYVIYTSGSSGKPKGVSISHESLFEATLAFRDELGVKSSDVFALISSLSFDISGLEIFVPLAVGGSIAVLNRSLRSDIPYCARQLSHSVTVLQATPTVWRLLLDAGWCPSRSMKLISGGEPLPLDLANSLSKDHTVWNMYGPTEATIWCTASRLAHPVSHVSIGRAIGRNVVHILNEKLEEVGVGDVGELYLGGAQLALGYVNQPKLTDMVFMQVRVSGNEVQRLYRSGDIGRKTADGEITLLGRNDSQVKLNGQRVELGDIENKLLENPDVSRAHVTVCKDPSAQPVLVAYIVCRGACISAQGSQLSTQESAKYKIFLRRVLPAHMIPTIYILVNSLPMLVSGKLDTASLPGPSFREISQPRDALQTADEMAIATVWKEVLRDDLSRNANVFEVGVTSMQSLQFVILLEQIGIDISVLDVYKYPTISQLAAHISRKGRRLETNRPVCIHPGAGESLFLVHCETGELHYAAALARHMNPNIPVYGMPPILEMDRESSVQEMATKMIGFMKEVSPKGPFHIAGYSFGGLVAYEIARQLRIIGDDVGYVGLFDTHPPSVGIVDDFYADKVDAADLLIEECLSDCDEGEESIRGVWSDMRSQSFEKVFEQLDRLGHLHGEYRGMDAAQAQKRLLMKTAFIVARKRYRAEKSNIPINIYTHSGPKFHQFNSNWNAVLDESCARIVVMKSPKGSMFQHPFVSELGIIVSAHLQR